MMIDPNKIVMYCQNCGLKVTVSVTATNVTSCSVCYGTSFTSQPPVCEDCAITHPGMSCNAAEEKFGRPCVL